MASIATSPVDLAYDAEHDTGLPPLLLVHGLLVSRDIWKPNAALSDHFRLIRVDLPAHGKSPAPSNPDQAHPDSIVQALDQLRRRLGIAEWHLCGQSFGSGIVLRYALTHPAACGRLVFTNATSALRGGEDQQQVQARRDLVASIVRDGQGALRKLPYHPAHARRFPPDLRQSLSDQADATDPQGLALLMQEGLPRLSVRDRLADMPVPKLLVNGIYERRFQPLRDWLQMAHPKFPICDLPGGHSVNVECPETFNLVVRTFLEGAEQGEPDADQSDVPVARGTSSRT